MKNLIIITVLLLSGFINSQTNFEKGMEKAFSLWEDNKWDDAENMFERIANAEPEQWLPHYYIAQMNSLKSWGQTDETILRAQLAKAQEHLNTAMRISDNNAELLVMQAHVYTNWVAFDGMTYGMKYSAKVSELYANAEKIDATNPRVIFGKAEWGMGSAKYFGQDTAPFCAQFEKALELFANFKPESKFHPNWGKERLVEVLKTCE